jgi:hypothetical protein
MKPKHVISIVVSFLLAIVIFNYSCTKDKGPLKKAPATKCDSLNIKYSTTIAHMMQTYCATSGCHEPAGSGSGDFTGYAGVKSKVNNGSMTKRVINPVPRDMPPSGPLPEALIEKLDCWIKSGAPNN